MVGGKKSWLAMAREFAKRCRTPDLHIANLGSDDFGQRNFAKRGFCNAVFLIFDFCVHLAGQEASKKDGSVRYAQEPV